MNKKPIYLFSAWLFLLISISLISCTEKKDDNFSESVKIALRDVGHQLLLSNQDSTSLVMPIIELNNTKYELSFQEQLSFDPSHLVTIVDSVFQKAILPKYYLVEVIQCNDKEIAYSYQMNAEIEKTIIPCGGRFLPKSCYTIELRFTHKAANYFKSNALLYVILISSLGFIIFNYVKKKNTSNLELIDTKFNTIGSFKFFPEQNKLVKEATEINLSKKECELLEIFVANPNQIIKRDVLEKRVWEDHGVIVGRSLDTYISKLRKKLKDDDSIKLTNVHGVGYKLELNT